MTAVRHLLNRFSSYLYRRFNNLAERVLDAYLTTHRRPRRADNFTHVSSPPPWGRIAIVIQGPIIATDDFTSETIRIYRKLFPETSIIVSTWNDTDPSLVTSIPAEGVELLLNEKPQYAGVSNVNLQITSTIHGIRKAKQLGANYVLKTRTDQRIYAVNAMAYLLALVKCFPLTEVTAQKERLISVSLGTLKYRPYGTSDMFLFGHIEDMLLYWDVPLDMRTDFPETSTIGTYVAAKICEVYFVTEFLKRIGYQPKFTIADGWNVYRKHFCIVDQQSVELLWIKSDRTNEYGRLRYDGLHTDDELTFRDWLLLYTGAYDPNGVPEAALGKAFGSML